MGLPIFILVHDVFKHLRIFEYAVFAMLYYAIWYENVEYDLIINNK